MTCPSCGAESSGRQRFCGACGAALTEADIVTMTSGAPRPAAPAAPGAGGADQYGRAGTGPTAGKPEQFLPGQMLAGRYRMVGLLGRGGMGEVYRADDLKLGQPVALKFLPRDVGRDGARLERFLAEGRLSLRVTHPNVCRVFDIGEVDDRHFLSMEYVDGEDLASLLRRIGRLPEDKAIEIARQLCAGLAAAHDAGVLHRDLKPSNIMIDGRGRTKITDFGLAGATSGIVGREARIGTPQYMAPEQFEGGTLTIQTDLYSLGLVLYEVFTGKRAFQSRDALEMAAERGSTPTSPGAVVAGLNPLVDRAILLCLQPHPADRPASAAALAASLPGGDPLAIAMAAGETPSPEMVARSGGRGALKPAVAIACLTIVLAGLVGAWVWNGQTDLTNRVPLPKPPAELRGLARAAIAAAGHAGERPWSASGWGVDSDYFRHVERTDRSPTRWQALATVTPAPIWFWYRESPEALTPVSSIRQAGPDNPPMTEPGRLRVILDPAGRMHELTVVPPELDTAGTLASEPDWTPLFASAGLSIAEWTATAPRWAAPLASDVRRAWTQGDVRIEAAAFRGKPVWFRIIPPWRQPADAGVTSATAAQRVTMWVLQALLVVMLAGSMLLAARNIRQGRSDRRAATRLVVVYLAIGLVSNVMRLSGDPSSWLRLVQNNLGGEIFVAGFIWIFYVALEPFIRRLWPGTIVAWTRALNGQLRDPLVGRHILLGALAGLALKFVLTLPEALGTFGVPPAAPAYGDLFALASSRARIAVMGSALQEAFAWPVIVLLFVLFCRVIFRRPWLAYLAIVAFGMFLYGVRGPAIMVPIGAMVYGLTLAIVTRLGLFAFCVAAVFASAPLGVTTDPDSWFFTESVLTVGAFAALATYGFFVSLGGQKVFGEDLLREVKPPARA